MPMKMILGVVVLAVAAMVAVAGYAMFKPPAQATARHSRSTAA